MPNEYEGQGVQGQSGGLNQEANPWAGQSDVDDEDDDDESTASAEYKPEDGKFGLNGDYGQQSTQQQSQYRSQSQQPQYDANGQPIEQPKNPLEEVSLYMNDDEWNFVSSLNPTQQGYFVNALSRIKNVYDVQSDQVAAYEQQLDQVAQQMEPLKDMNDAISDKVAAAGYDDTSEYFEALVEADMRMSENPTGAILDIMQYYGIKLDELYQDAVYRTDQLNDPYYEQAQQAQKERDAYQAYIEDMHYNQQLAEQQETEAFLQEQITAFAAEQDEYGQYTHPYFTLVENQMAQLMMATGEYDLEKLYDQACWADPDIRNDMMQSGGGYQGQQQYYNQPQYQQPQQQYYQPNSPAQTVARFATSNSPGDSGVRPSGGRDFAQIYRDNYQKFTGQDINI